MTRMKFNTTLDVMQFCLLLAQRLAACTRHGLEGVTRGEGGWRPCTVNLEVSHSLLQSIRVGGTDKRYQLIFEKGKFLNALSLGRAVHNTQSRYASKLVRVLCRSPCHGSNFQVCSLKHDLLFERFLAPAMDLTSRYAVSNMTCFSKDFLPLPWI